MSAISDALDCLGNIISDAPYRGEERDGAWQAFLENRKIIEDALVGSHGTQPVSEAPKTSSQFLSVPVDRIAQQDKDHGAALLPVDASANASTEPLPNPEGNPWNAVEELGRLLQAADGLKAGSLTFPGMWHYAEIARRALKALLPVDSRAAVTTEPLPNSEHERVLLLTNIRTSAASGLTYGTGPTPHTSERIIERKNKALRDILTFLERDGIVGSILRSITEDEIGSVSVPLSEHSDATNRSASAIDSPLSVPQEPDQARDKKDRQS